MPEKVSLSNYWLTKTYPVDGRRFVFIWGVTAMSMDDAFRIVKTPEVQGMIGDDNRRAWNYAMGSCVLEKRSDQPEPEGDNFSIRDDRIKRRMPGQLNFGF